MKGTFIKKGILVCIALLSGAFSSFAQTITTGDVSPTTVCAGSTISVAFAKSGTFPANTQYTVQLSNALGLFIGATDLGSGTASPVSVEIPAGATASLLYKVRVVTKTPAVTGTESGLFTVVASPAAPTASDVNYNQGQTATQLKASGSNHKWYTAATGGTGSATAPTPSTATVGTKSYYVTQTQGSCESERTEIKVTVTACTAPDAPDVANITYCLGAKAAVLTAQGNGLKWYTSKTGGTALASAPTPDTDKKGVTSYFVSQTVQSCESDRAELKVTVNVTDEPVVKDISYCQKEDADPLTATGSGLKWYTAATGGTGSATAPTPSTTTIGTKSYYVSQTQNGCESERAEIVVTVKTISATPILTAAEKLVNVCQDSDAKALSATGTGLKWYTSASGGTALSAAPVPDTEETGTTSYYVSQTSTGACESPARAKVDVVVQATPASPTVEDVAYCVGEKAVALTVEKGDPYRWYTTATGGTGLATAPIPATTTAATTSYYVTQATTYGAMVCESPRAKLTVEVHKTPAAIIAATDSVCQERVEKTYTFDATAATGNDLNWYAAATGGTALAKTPTASLKTAGASTFYVSQETENGCESPRTAQKLVVKILPSAPGLDKPTVEYCQFAPATALTATAISKASLSWYTVATGGTASSAAPVPKTAEGGTTSYYVSQTLAGCVSDRAKVNVQVNTTPKPQTTTSLAYCQNEEAPVLDATGTVLKWYREANSNEWQGFPFTPYTAKVEDYSFYVTQTGANDCESPKEEIKIHIKSLPSATISGTAAIDLGETANVTLQFTGDGPWTYALSDGTTATTSQATVQLPVKPTKTITYLVTEVSNACGKGVPIGSAVVTVRVPTISSGNPSVSEQCAGKTFTVPFQQSGEFPAANQFKVQISTANQEAKYFTVSSVAANNVVTATFPDTISGGRYFVRVVSVGTDPAFMIKGSASQITITASPLPVGTLSGNQSIIAGETADLKADITGKAPWTFVLSDGVKDTTFNAAASPYNFKVAPRSTVVYTIKSISNSCGTGSGKGSARIQVDPILAVEPPVSVDWVKVYPTLIQTGCTVEITGALSAKGAKAEIVDMNGRARSVNKLRQKVSEINFSNLPSGIYLLRVQNGDLSTVQRVMKH